ncbi:uncharacterized protein LOC121396371 [Xenopus laevis]|uniref:Uncharacterized protein LOC121396371 n=1 Tax=Xenopus laevis TaxID=8355 RepID=A0A8J1LDU9_XENLA|nr:uncharacterized protein LOC121396371 [Xenopus laevis]
MMSSANMHKSKPRRISKEVHKMIEDMANTGMTVPAIHQKLQTLGITASRQTVRYHASGKAKTGCNRPTTTNNTVYRQTMSLVEEITKENDETTARQIKVFLATKYQQHLSLSTIRRMRRKLGWRYGKVRYSPMIRDVNKEKRVIQAQQWLNSGETFNDVIFTDETSVALERFARFAFNRKDHLSIKPRPKHPVKVHVWGGISRKGAGPLVIFEGIMDKAFFIENIVDSSLVPYIQQHWPSGHRLFQDNDPKHSAAASHLELRGIRWERTPPESPDFNAIEMIWANLKYHIRTVYKPKTKEELINGIRDYWLNVLSVDLCNKCIDHLANVLPVAIERGGQATGM